MGSKKQACTGPPSRQQWLWLWVALFSRKRRLPLRVSGDKQTDIGGESVTRWCSQDEVNQEESEQNAVDGMKKGADSTGKAMHIYKSGW